MKSVLALAVLLAAPAMAQEIAPSATQLRPLLVGSTAPDVQLRRIDGTPVSLKTALSGRPGVVIFYRGGWCPYCNAHLEDIKTIDKKLVKLGYQTLAISPDRPEELAKTMKKHALPYSLLSDSKFAAAGAFGIAYQVDDQMLKKYVQYGVDLRKASGEEHDWLPVPSVFLIGADGAVKFVYANPDYRVRLKGKVLLAAAEAALEAPAKP